MTNAGGQVATATSAPASANALAIAKPKPASSATPATRARLPRRSIASMARSSREMLRHSSAAHAKAPRAPTFIAGTGTGTGNDTGTHTDNDTGTDTDTDTITGNDTGTAEVGQRATAEGCLDSGNLPNALDGARWRFERVPCGWQHSRGRTAGQPAALRRPTRPSNCGSGALNPHRLGCFERYDRAAA